MPWIQVTQEAIDLLVIDSLLSGRQMSTEQVLTSPVNGRQAIYVDAEVMDFLRNRLELGESLSDVIVRLFKKEDK